MNKPKLTIMIPTYGQEKYILEAVNSALSQDYDNLEVVVTDDCSPDNTGRLLKSIDDHRLVYHRNPQNLGRVGNYHNTAHNVATGDWAVNLDGDDYYTSNTFAKEAMEFIANLPQSDNVVVYFFSINNFDKVKATIPYKVIDENRIMVSGKDYFINYFKCGEFHHPAIIFRRDLGVSINLYTLQVQACDFHSLIRIFLLGNIILDKRKIHHWRIHGNNTTIVEAADKHRQAMLTYDAIEEFAKDYFSPQQLQIWRRNMNKQSLNDYILTYTYQYRNLKAIKLLIRHPRFKRWYFRAWFKQIFNR